MASIINASTTSTTGLVQSADASGVLQLQSNGTTGLTVGSGGLLTAANGIVMSSMTLGTAVAGEFEYDGRVPYFTPQSTQRGVVPGMQYYRLDSALAGSNVNTAQNIFGVGVTLSANTVYAFQSMVALLKTAGTTSHTTSIGFAGTATVNNIGYEIIVGPGAGSSFTAIDATYYAFIQTTSSTAVQIAVAQATVVRMWKIFGTVSVNAGGTFIPQYTLSASPGGAYSTQAGSYFSIWPIGASGSNTSVGTWA